MREIILNGYIDDEVWFGDEITPENLHAVLYDDSKNQTEDVHIRLNSYGGSCNAAVRMHDDIAAYPGKVNITVSGTAASAATVLCMAADHLEMTPGSLWMIHDPSIMAIGNVRALKDAIHLLEACKESILNVYSARIRITREQASAMMTKTTWMDAQTALEDGFIDSILTVKQAGPQDSIISQPDAEKKVQMWIDRHNTAASIRNNHIPLKEGVLHEAQDRPSTAEQASQMAEETQEPSSSAAEEVPTASPPVDQPQPLINPGTPISQLQKRLALIMPPEAKNKGEAV